MSNRFNLNTRQKIFWSFAILFLVFVGNTVISLVAVNNASQAGSWFRGGLITISVVSFFSLGIFSLIYLGKKITRAASQDNRLPDHEIVFEQSGKKLRLNRELLAMRENLHAANINLERNNKELERKNKELEQFAFVASHDLQEPLRTASSFVGLLQQQYKDRLDEKGNKYLDYISQASDQMQALVNDLLEYARIGIQKDLQNVDCNIILKEVLSAMNAAITEAGAQVNSTALPVICGYPAEIKQLFQHLISNAIKFRQKDIPPVISIAACKSKEEWQFSFRDNGIGIAKEHHERIFIIFQRLHIRSQYPGSGIGLSHCRKIVELHKGKIWLESEPATGTTFYFTLSQTA